MLTERSWPEAISSYVLVRPKLSLSAASSTLNKSFSIGQILFPVALNGVSAEFLRGKLGIETPQSQANEGVEVDRHARAQSSPVSKADLGHQPRALS
jgi:hypothetical protein